MIGFLFDSQAVRVRREETGSDPLGRPVLTETSRTTYPFRLEQRGTQEGESFAVDSWQGYTTSSADIRPRDVIEEGGRRFEVEGTPALNRIPRFPGADHLAVNLKYVGEIS